jgi:predicted nuclease with TOPRIM domain
MQKTRVSPPAIRVGLFTVLLALYGLPLAAETASPAEAHDLYNPARTALVNAQLQLAESSQQQREFRERAERMVKGMDNSLAQLENAAQLDPAMRVSIEEVREKLAALRQEASLCSQENAATLDAYDQLLNDLQNLIERY